MHILRRHERELAYQRIFHDHHEFGLVYSGLFSIRGLCTKRQISAWCIQSCSAAESPLVAKSQNARKTRTKFRPTVRSRGGPRFPVRRRRRPEDAQSEILDAAEVFLRDHSFHAMTVDDLMARTGLSRPSF